MEYTKRTILVTGAAGFIGSHFIEHALEVGDTVIGLDNLVYDAHKKNISSFENHKNFYFVKGDICDGELVSSLLEEHCVDAIINSAAESDVEQSIEDPASYVRTNIDGTFSLLEAARAYYKENEDNLEQFRFIQLSTYEVFGSLAKNDRLDEEHAFHPHSPFAATKAASDHLVHVWHDTYGLPTIITYACSIYGPRQFPEKMIPYMLARALNDRSLPVYGDGKNVRDWMHVDDHARGIRLALEHSKAGEVYCFSGNEEIANLDMVHLLCDLFDKLKPREDGTSYKSLTKFIADRPAHDKRYVMDSTKAKSLLGFQCLYDLDRGLHNTVEWYLDNPEWVVLPT